jgi:hypothetical protein
MTSEPNTATTPHPIPLPDEWLTKIKARHAIHEGGAWHLNPEPHRDPDTVRTTISGYHHQIGILHFSQPYAEENRTFVLHAHQDMRLLLDEVDRLRSRVSELETAAEQADGDEWVRCAHPHCPNGEWFAKAAERGWEHGHMDTWLCPQCAADAAVDGAPTVAWYSSRPCDVCDHTLHWHCNDVGCTAPRCACVRFKNAAL